jgi:hypothetical protein
LLLLTASDAGRNIRGEFSGTEKHFVATSAAVVVSSTVGSKEGSLDKSKGADIRTSKSRLGVPI